MKEPSVCRRIVARLSYANVTATVALFVALGGTGYAAASLPRNSVGSRQLRSAAVTHSALARDAVTSSNIRTASIDLSDLSARARGALVGATGASGEVGAPGITGIPGPAGPAGARGDDGPAGASVTSLWESVSSFPSRIAGTATSVTEVANGVVDVLFEQPLTSCAAVASLARVEGGGVVDPPAGYATVADLGDRIRVQTYGANGVRQASGFNLLVVC